MKILGSFSDRIARNGNHMFQKSADFTLDLQSFVDLESGECIEAIFVPCGKCTECRLAKSREWANRCCLEALEHPLETNWFLTLTYNDDHIESTVKNPDTDIPTYSLVKEHMQEFMKNLRAYWKYHYNHDGIRFYGAGEYGLEGRPHYHILVFNLPYLDDHLTFYKKNMDGDFLFKSDLLSKEIWKRGFVVVGNFNWHTAAYTARYVMKKRKGKDANEYYENAGVDPEFALMSRRPGIGVDYFSGYYEDIYENDRIVLPASRGQAHIIQPPKYFDKKLKDLDPFLMEKIKKKRERVNEIREEVRRSQTTLSDFDYLQVQGECKDAVAKALRRIL